MNQAREEMLKDKLDAIDNILYGVSNHDALGILVGAIGKVFSGYSSFAAQNKEEAVEQPPSCAECVVLKPCELQYFSDRCFNRLRQHFLLA